MGKSMLKNKTIMKLEEEIKQGNKKALEEFWLQVQQEGSPLMEEIGGNPENDLVTFVYKAEEECENVMLIPGIGTPNLEECKMERLMDTDLWHITYEIRNDIRFPYYLPVNDPLDDDCKRRFEKSVHDRFNKNAIVLKLENGEEKPISYVVMRKAEEQVWVKERRDVHKGRLQEHQLESGILKGQRMISVYTPWEYDEGKKPYGFLVLTDGEEYIRILSAVQILDNLIAEGKIPPLVAIFVDTTENRDEELRCSDAFGDMLVKEVIPLARENYNISSNPEEAVIGGLSLGGLTASYLGLKHSEVFGNVLSQSGSHWFKPEGFECDGNDCWMSTQYKSADKLPLKFYLNVGVIEHKELMIDTNENLRDVLTSRGYSVDFEMFKSGHDYLCWGETLAKGLISLVGVKQDF